MKNSYKYCIVFTDVRLRAVMVADMSTHRAILIEGILQWHIKWINKFNVKLLSLSGCPLAAMEKTSHKDKCKMTIPMALPPANPSPIPPPQSIAICQPMTSDRVLRPMCFVKQLDLPGQYTSGQVASYATPRTNLAKELEKYSKPQGPEFPLGPQPVVTSPTPQYGRPLIPKATKLMPNEPNIHGIVTFRERTEEPHDQLLLEPRPLHFKWVENQYRIDIRFFWTDRNTHSKQVQWSHRRCI